MRSTVSTYDHFPPDAANYGDAPTRLWVWTGTPGASAVAVITQTDTQRGLEKPPERVARDRGWAPALSILDPSRFPDLFDWTVRQFYPVFRYWITTPDVHVGAVRSFIEATQLDRLPNGWEEAPAKNDDGVSYTLCRFQATLSQARSLGAQQTALQELAGLPSGAHFFQAIIDRDGFTGIEKESRQPVPLTPSLYEPGDLFQTDVEELSDHRGHSFTEQDALDASGLRLV